MTLNITERTEAAIGNSAKVRLRDVPLEVYRVLEPVKVRVIESIEHLCAELNAILFLHLPILVQREIHVVDRLTSDGTFSQAPELSHAW